MSALYPCRLPVMTQRLLCLNMTSLCKCVFLMWSRSASFEEFGRHLLLPRGLTGRIVCACVSALGGGSVWFSCSFILCTTLARLSEIRRKSCTTFSLTVTSVSLASGQPAGAKWWSGFPLQCLCGLSLPHHWGQPLRPTTLYSRKVWLTACCWALFCVLSAEIISAVVPTALTTLLGKY